MKKHLLVLLLSFVAPIAYGQTWNDTVKSIETIFSRYKPLHPGCQLAISRNGKLVFSHAWGMADLEHQTPLTTTSIIEAGSVSKQFTAAAILLLEQQGKLSLDDDVHKYIPELPDYHTPLTLKQMMHHTSGLKDWGSLMALSDWPRGTKIYSNHDVLNIMCRQPTLNNVPGNEYLYSNSNYVLFAIIVERVSGLTLADFTLNNIFKPAGMTHTQWRNDIKKIVPDRAIAYGYTDGKYFTDMPYENVYGNGGLLTTAEDLLKWNNYYLSGKLGNPSLLQKQFATDTLNNGKKNIYAAGLRITSVNGWKTISHDGATAAYRSDLEFYPELGLSFAWIANTSEFDNTGDGTNDLRDLLLKKTKTATPPQKNAAGQAAKTGDKDHAPAAFTINVQNLQAYTGAYYSDEVDSGLWIAIKDGKLVIQRVSKAEYKLIPVGKDCFNIENSNVTVKFNRDLANKISHFYFTTPKVRNVAFRKL